MGRLTFLGTGDSMGVPRVYCECRVCGESRTTGENRRLRSSVMIDTEGGRLLLDCGPDWTLQMETLGERVTTDVLITHAHFDHVGGLPEWADSLRWLGRKGNLYAPGEVIRTLRQQFPWLGRVIVYHENDAGHTFGEWRIRPWKVCHGKNGFSYAYLFEKPDFRWAYCSDSINLQGEEKAPLAELDLLVLGTSFYQEQAEFHTRSVYDMVEAFALLEEIRPRQTVFTHLSHGVDLRAAYPLPDNVRLARTGMTVELEREPVE